MNLFSYRPVVNLIHTRPDNVMCCAVQYIEEWRVSSSFWNSWDSLIETHLSRIFT